MNPYELVIKDVFGNVMETVGLGDGIDPYVYAVERFEQDDLIDRIAAYRLTNNAEPYRDQYTVFDVFFRSEYESGEL